MIKRWKDNNTLRRVRESEEAKTIVSTASLTLEPGKTINFAVSRVVNGNPTGKRTEKELAYLEQVRDGKYTTTEWVGSVLKALARDIENEDVKPAICYELETSLSSEGKKVSSQTEIYNCLDLALEDMAETLAHPSRVPFEGFDNDKIGGLDDIREKDRDAESDINEKVLERIPLDIRKKCKEACIKARAKYEERDAEGRRKYQGSPCKYNCAMSTGNEVNSGWCICQELHIKRPYEWDV